MTKQSIIFSDPTNWTKLQEVMHNAVVQVFAQVGRFNWLEPYKIEEESESRGSGFLISEEGYIVTNAHVVHEAKRVWVHMPFFGREVIHVDVVGFCPERDLALLRIKPKELADIKARLQIVPFLRFGDSDLVRPTDSILVLGYPLGQYRLKSTMGIVSGREAGYGQALIQMTAPVNPGSSGGPVLNSQGEVIGITIAMIYPANSVGYAIPINELKQILDNLYTENFVRIPFLGAQFIASNDSKAEYLGNPKPAGLYICKVLKDMLFDKAGIKAGDMLYEFNGFRLDAYGETIAPWSNDKTPFTDLIARVNIGEEIFVVIYRDGKRFEIKFKYELLPPYPIRRMYPDYENIEFETIAGMVIMQLAENHLPILLDYAPDLIKYMEAQEKEFPKLVITHVIPGSLSYQLRSILPGDIIKEVNGVKVTVIDELRAALEKSVSANYLTLITGRDIFAAFSLEDILADELHLSKDFIYPLSKTVERLLDLSKKKYD